MLMDKLMSEYQHANDVVLGRGVLNDRFFL